LFNETGATPSNPFSRNNNQKREEPLAIHSSYLFSNGSISSELANCKLPEIKNYSKVETPLNYQRESIEIQLNRKLEIFKSII
jgi:hypothetical protein